MPSMKALTVRSGGGEKSLRCDHESELRLGGSKARRAKITNGMEKEKGKEQLLAVTHVCRLLKDRKTANVYNPVPKETTPTGLSDGIRPEPLFSHLRYAS